MDIVELHSLSSDQVVTLLQLMKELAPEREVSAEMLENVVASANTHLFAALNKEGHIVGCASLCVFDSPTGRKASVEDVVVSSSTRGQGIGRGLMEFLIEFARRELGNVDLHLTSKPTRVAANALYQSLGFEKRDTNFYRMRVRGVNESLA